MVKQKSSNPKGVLNPKEAQQHFTLKRFTPSDPVAYFVEHFWIVQWDLPKGKIFHQDVLSHPSIHLVFEEQNTKIYGVVTGKFTRELEGTGKVLGIKFRPGGFYPFYQSPVSSLTDDVLAPNTVFETDIDNLEQSILSADPERMAELAEGFLNDMLPKKDEQVQQVNAIVEAIISDQTLITVKQLAEQFGISKRTLQRRFRRYVGVSPKWVIKRFRLHEAAARLDEDAEADWTEIALELGYFDQAHFINDFKSIVGQTPGEYAKG